jgi:HK97 gp10 family phage protein
MTAGLQGLDAWRKRLDALPQDIKAELATEVARSAEDVATLARAFVPVETGDLRATITVEPGDTETGKKVTAGFPARFVEFGTKPHIAGGKFKGARHPGTAARPFMFAAFRILRRAIRFRMSRAVRRAVKGA